MVGLLTNVELECIFEGGGRHLRILSVPAEILAYRLLYTSLDICLYIHLLSTTSFLRVWFAISPLFDTKYV